MRRLAVLAAPAATARADPAPPIDWAATAPIAQRAPVATVLSPCLPALPATPREAAAARRRFASVLAHGGEKKRRTCRDAGSFATSCAHDEPVAFGAGAIAHGAARYYPTRDACRADAGARRARARWFAAPVAPSHGDPP